MLTKRRGRVLTTPDKKVVPLMVERADWYLVEKTTNAAQQGLDIFDWLEFLSFLI